MDNAALIREGYEAFAAGDLDRIRKIFADDIRWRIGGHSPIAGEYKGPDEVFAFFGKLFELTEGTFKLDVQEIVANDDHVVVLTHGTARRGDKVLDQDSVHIWSVKDGHATEFRGFDEDQYLGDAFFA
jgi:uncharacterized protein